MGLRHRPREGLSTYVTGFALVLFAAAVVMGAGGAFQASLFGLRLWLEAVLPALMPFFALSEILAAMGVIHFMAVLLEPIMRPLFNIPGAGGFALAMGLVSGYPLGALITARLCRDRLLNPVEGERLVALANTADPLFMAGVVAAGFFKVPELGPTLSLSHYLAVFGIGLLGAFHERHALRTPAVASGRREPLLARALAAMAQARQADGRPFGSVLGDSVRSAMSSMLLIGGTIILFSVLLQVLEQVGVVRALGTLVGWFLELFGLPGEMSAAVLRGLLEITNGTQAAATGPSDLATRAAMASFVIGWSGLSVHAQVAALVQDTGIRMGPYILARLAHGLLAGLTTVLLIRVGLGPAAAAVAGRGEADLASGLAAAVWHLRWAAGLAALTAAAVALGTIARAAAGWLGRALGWRSGTGGF